MSRNPFVLWSLRFPQPCLRRVLSSVIYRRAVRCKSTAVSHEYPTSIVRIAGFMLGLQFHPKDGDDIFKHATWRCNPEDAVLCILATTYGRKSMYQLQYYRNCHDIASNSFIRSSLQKCGNFISVSFALNALSYLSAFKESGHVLAVRIRDDISPIFNGDFLL